MKIKRLQIENFRAIASFDEELGPYTTFIGYNGGGKSSILHAVRWFFENFELADTDVFSKEFGERGSATLPEVKVTVTFDQLTEVDRENFGPYARGEEIVLTRVGGAGRASKLYGERLACPSFREIRKENRIAEQRKRALELINSSEIFSNLNISNKTSKQDLTAILDDWEADPENRKHLVPIDDEEANHFFGAVGSDKLKIDSGFVFIPAAPDLTGQFDVSGKGSALQLLLGDILKGVVNESINEWSERNQSVLDELESTVSRVAANRLNERAGLVNQHLEQYLPGVEIEFAVGLQDWVPKANLIAQSRMQRGDRNFVIESEGHGVQRATLLALLQATADSRAEFGSTRGDDHGDKRNQHSDQRSSLIVFVEEPEVYQHPVQARMMARSFTNAARTGNVQFILATHSPYFLDPNEIRNTFRVENSSSGSKVNRPSIRGVLREKNEKGELDKLFLESVIESLFSRAAMVVEGDTERAIFDTVPCGDDGLTLRDLGVSVTVAGGADSLLDMAQLIHDFGVPVFVVRDGDSDADIALAKAKSNKESEIRKRFKCDPNFENEEHLKIAIDKQRETLGTWESKVGTFLNKARVTGFGEGLDHFRWGGGTQISRHIGILDHDLESELHNWPSFMKASKDVDLPSDLRQAKKAGILARVAAQSRREDMPTGLKCMLEAVRQLVDHGSARIDC
ncbi:ATP-dependent nuclease [Dermabacteraceae bacterium P7054]